MLDKKYDFKTKEEYWQNYWTENKIYAFDENAKEKYLIDTPPPTISGNIHLGHVFSYIQTDTIARYQRMSGKSVYYPWGFDDNGLPTDKYVQKTRKIRLDQITREEYIKICDETTAELRKVYLNNFKTMGLSADFSNPYSTNSQNTRKITQQSFVELFQKGDIVRRKSATLWCPDCQTAIAQSELENKELESAMNYITFGVKGSDERIKIGTTRPEMLCACVCVFVHPDDKARAHLVGKTAISPIYNVEVPIMANPECDMEKGTGAVMCCTFGDEADAKWQKEYNLPIKEAITPYGRMTDLAGEFAGLKIVECREKIIEKLRELGILYDQQILSHNVATHERCGTTIEILSKPQWFVRLLDRKAEIYKMGEQVKWYPERFQKRFLNWVENLKWDWCISRQRYFGVPFPVWYCEDCGETLVADLKDLPIDPISTAPKCACPKCGGKKFKPDTDIMDTWATSSLTPEIGIDLITKKGLTDKFLPLDLRPTAQDNVSVWNFYTIAKSLLHYNKLPWKNSAISGWGLSATGQKLSKSKSNGGTLSPQEYREKYSSDVTRYWASNASLGKDVYITEEEFNNGFKLMQKIWNASKFVLSFLDNYTPKKTDLLPMDAWIIECYKQTFKSYCSYLNKYEMGLALNSLEQLFWNFCDNYIEIAKNRLYKPEIYGKAAKESAQYASSQVLLGMLKMFSIYMPHVTEEIYQDYFAKIEKCKSIHISNFIDLGKKFDDALISKGNEVCEIVSQIRGYKSQKGLSLKEELENVTITGYGDFVASCADDIKAVGNIKNLIFKKGEKSVEIK